MQPSATAARTAGTSKAPFRASSDASSPMRPNTTAAAEATSASLSFSFAVKRPTALASRRIPIELITPIKQRPLSRPAASRNPSSTDASGMTSKGMRAQAAMCSSPNNGSSAGTAFFVPHRANCLQAIALSPGWAFDVRTAISFASWAAASSAACRFAAANATIAAAAVVVRMTCL